MQPKYLMSKLDNNVYCVSNGQFQKHLNFNGIAALDYYEQYVTGITPLCQFCFKRLSANRHSIDLFEYYDSCGESICRGKAISKTKMNFSIDKIEDINSKIKNTKDNWSSVQKQTAMENLRIGLNTPDIFGITPIDKTAIKRKQTKLKLYGDEYWSNPIKATNTKKEWSDSKRKLINEKRKETCLTLYGVENVLDIDSIKEKIFISGVCYKNYKKPSGEIIKIQGYEFVGLDILYSIYKEDDIVTNRKEVPIIHYNYNRMLKRHYPDIFIKSENKIIEIKSRYTFKVQFEKNILKRDAAEKLGYKYEFWICNTKKILEKII